MTYTFDDIVTAKDILTGRVRKEDIIGKKGYFLDRIPQDMSLDTIMRLAGNPTELKKIDLDMSYVFENKDDFYHYFLPEKEEPVCHTPDYLTDKSIFFIDFQAFCSLQTLWEIHRDLCPEIKGYTIDDKGYFIAFDNTAREFFEEDFDTREEAVAWLRGEEAEKPEYIPFDLSKPEDRDFLRGKWIRKKDDGREVLIDHFEKTPGTFAGWKTEIWGANNCSSGYLFDKYTFIDGTPCGKRRTE